MSALRPDTSELDLNSKQNHDLQAQILNVKGFCEEINRSANELEILRGSEDFRLNTEISGKLDELINDDLLPCIRFLALSTNKLGDVITEFHAPVKESGENL